jgi:hypothetical protein
MAGEIAAVHQRPILRSRKLVMQKEKAPPGAFLI